MQCRGLSKTHTKILRCVTTFLGEFGDNPQKLHFFPFFGTLKLIVGVKNHFSHQNNVFKRSRFISFWINVMVCSFGMISKFPHPKKLSLSQVASVTADYLASSNKTIQSSFAQSVSFLIHQKPCQIWRKWKMKWKQNISSSNFQKIKLHSQCKGRTESAPLGN